MKNPKTEIIFILDRSGSMSGLEEDTIGGFNSMIEKQKEIEGEARVTTVLFDHEYELIHDRFDLKDIRLLSGEQYFVRGSTALLDAVGRTMEKMVGVQKNQSEEARADKVMFVIITDGMENSSKMYNYRQIREMISYEEKKFGWEFIFLGANIDAAREAGKMGIRADRAVDYHADKKGTASNFNTLKFAFCELRKEGELSESWREEADKDFEERK